MHNNTTPKRPAEVGLNGVFRRIMAFLHNYLVHGRFPSRKTEPLAITVKEGVGLRPIIGPAQTVDSGIAIPIVSDGWLYADDKDNSLRVSSIILDGREIAASDTFAINMDLAKVRCYVRDPRTKRIIIGVDNKPLVNEYEGQNLQVNWHPETQRKITGTMEGRASRSGPLT